MQETADVLVVTVTPIESSAIYDCFRLAEGREPQIVTVDGHAYYELGRFNGASVFMAFSEMGSGVPGGSQQAVRRAIEALQPYSVIMVGIAFGVDEGKQQIGEVLVSQQLSLYDLQRVGNELILRGDKPHASTRLINLCQACVPLWTGAKVRLGMVLTGDKLVDNVDYRDQLKSVEPEAVGGEMEGAGLYVACLEKKVDWILVKAICDWADGKKDNPDKKKHQKLAAENAASFVLEVLKRVSLARPDESGIGLQAPHDTESRQYQALRDFASALAGLQPPTVASPVGVALVAKGDLGEAADRLCKITRERYAKALLVFNEYGDLLSEEAREALECLRSKIEHEELMHLANVADPNVTVPGERIDIANLRHHYFKVAQASIRKQLRELDGKPIEGRELIDYRFDLDHCKRE